MLIPLTRGYNAIIDAIDADLGDYYWSATGSGSRFYAQGSMNGKRPYMHRVIMERMLGRELQDGEQVDHIDNDPLNNQRSNLRIATHRQNVKNRKRHRNNKSGFKGVYYNKRAKRYHAQIRVGGKHIYLGLHDTPEEAHEAYCEAADKYHGEFARYE